MTRPVIHSIYSTSTDRKSDTLAMETTDRFTSVLAERVHELEDINRHLRQRIGTLERTRDRQRLRIRGLYYQLALHRQRVRDARASRDLWKHRAML